MNYAAQNLLFRQILTSAVCRFNMVFYSHLSEMLCQKSETSYQHSWRLANSKKALPIFNSGRCSISAVLTDSASYQPLTVNIRPLNIFTPLPECGIGHFLHPCCALRVTYLIEYVLDPQDQWIFFPLSTSIWSNLVTYCLL